MYFRNHFLFVLGLTILVVQTATSVTLTVNVSGDSASTTAGNFDGTSSGDLRGVLNYINQDLSGSGTYDVVFSGSVSVTLNAPLPVINQYAANTVSITGPATIDGQNLYRGLFANQGTVTLDNLTIQNTYARGGDSTVGGGGLGAGAGLFVNQAQVSLSDVAFVNNQAAAGLSAQGFGENDGGGGMGGDGGTGGLAVCGGGGLVGHGGSFGGGGGSIGNGGDGGGVSAGGGGGGCIGCDGGSGSNGNGGVIATGGANSYKSSLIEGGGGAALSGVGGNHTLTTGGGNGGGSTGGNGGFGGGGGGGVIGGGNGGPGGGGGNSGVLGGNGGNGGFGGGGGSNYYNTDGNGGNGGFGGGGGNGGGGNGGNGGFGGGGGNGGGGGGFGGGGAGGNGGSPGSGGVGGCGGSSNSGGDGAAFGGAIFINRGNIGNSSGSGGAITSWENVTISGSGVSNRGGQGAAVGSSIFITSGGSPSVVTFSPSSSCTISASIADDSENSIPTGQTYTPGSNAGASLVMNGSGTLILSGANTYAAGTSITAGTLRMGAINVMPSIGSVSVAGGVFDLNNYNQSIGAFSGSTNTTLGSAALTVNSSSSTTYSGVMSGSGSFIKQGSGTLTLEGANTYTGGTTISAGTLQMGVANGLASTGAVQVVGGVFNLNNYNQSIGAFSGSTNTTFGSASLTANSSSSTTYSGVMSGSGSFIKQGSGTLTLEGANTYTGGTTISAGTLQMGVANGLSSTGSVAVAGGIFDLNDYNQSIGAFSGSSNTTLGSAALTVNSSSSTTYSGVMSGSGSFIKQGSGTLTLEGANTYTGGTTISAGTLQMGVANGLASTGAVQVVGGVFNLNNYNQSIGNFSGTTNTTLGSAALTISSSSPSSTYSGVMSGSGSLVKQGVGTLVLTGTNTYTGGTLVQAGGLLMGSGGSLANQTVTVSSGATLGGVGVIGTSGATVNNSGHLSPGLSPGVLTINGNYTQTSSGYFVEELYTKTDSDLLIVNGGAVSLAGSLDVILLPDHSLFGRNNLVIINNSAGTGVTGTFDHVNKSGFPSGSFLNVIYQPNQVLLDFHTVDHQALSPGNISAPVLSQITQNTLNFSRHLEQIRPISMKKFQEMYSVQIEEEPLIASNEVVSYVTASQKRRGKVLPSNTWEYVHPREINTWGVFADTIGSLGRVYSSSVNRAFDYWNVGGLVGFDYVGEKFAIGFSPGYEYLSAHALDYPNRFNIQSALGTIFATVLPYQQRNLFIDFIGGGAYQWYHFQRPTPYGVLKSRTQGGQWNLFSDVGYTFDVRDFIYSSYTAIPFITPWVGLGYMGVYVQGFQEESLEVDPANALVELDVNVESFNIGNQSFHSLRSALGLTMNYDLRWETFSFLPEIRVLWQREFLNHDSHVAISLLPNIDTQAEVLGLGRDTVVIGGVLRLLFQERTDLYGSYDYEWNEKFHSHLFLLGLEQRF